MAVQLLPHQSDALKNMHNGCILCGGVGSGKSITGLAYYHTAIGGGQLVPVFEPMGYKQKKEGLPVDIPDLIIITTARKRDTLEWEKECARFGLSTDPKIHYYKKEVRIDSWNNIGKYVDEKDCFFIFDEQRVIGKGEWVKSFLKIARNNQWILLSATPGDTWMDYIPVFLANGFYKNRTEFIHQHVVYDNFSKYPKVSKYVNTGRLLRLRSNILVNMEFRRTTISHNEDIITDYNIAKYKDVMRERWDCFKNEPIINANGLCIVLRHVVNTDASRLNALLELLEEHPKAIIFYNYDYELEALRATMIMADIPYAEWNGHMHQDLPKGPKWVYLCQYLASCEGWNCITTDTVIFYSQNYSYKVMTQAAGRIDRLNTPYMDLYYYHLKSRAPIDLAIARALKSKKKFNEEMFVRTINNNNL